MSTEAMITIALAAIGGMCVLMWNTDGSLDWLSTATGATAALLWWFVLVWNNACSILSYVGSAAAGQAREAVMLAIQARAWSWEVTSGLFALFVIFSVLPYVFTAARKARR